LAPAQTPDFTPFDVLFFFFGSMILNLLVNWLHFQKRVKLRIFGGLCPSDVTEARAMAPLL
jgi:hypothetical protein